MEKLLSNAPKMRNSRIDYSMETSRIYKKKCNAILGLNLMCKFVPGLSINKS
jgi:hypothetical protein